MVKSRHKILMPTLVLHLTKTKLNQDGEYKSSFARNIHERTDKPVFTIDDAVNQLKATDQPRTEVEKAMDSFFVTHLPQEILDEAGGFENNELDEDAIRRQKRADLQKSKKHQTQSQLAGDALGGNRHGSGYGMPKPVKQKSDLTLAFVDSSEQVARLAKKSEMGEKIDKMRTLAKTDAAMRKKKTGRLSEVVNPQISALSREDGSFHRRGSDASGTNSPRVRKTMSPDAFKKKYSKDGGLVQGGLGHMLGQQANLSRFNKDGSSDDSEDQDRVDPVVIEVAQPKGEDGDEWGL